MSDNPAQKHTHVKLGQMYATAICGNDILSSCLYVSGIASIFAGVYAPIVLMIVAAVLYFFRHVYTEVVEALPINGGAYNCLLNGTSKPVAAIAGVMTILSYVATACISAKVGVEYFHTIYHGFDVMVGTVALLALFAILVINGLKDSAKVALFIFLFHIATLTALIILGAIHAISNGTDVFMQNYALTRDFAGTTKMMLSHKSFWYMMFLAFSASLLGVSGFESSANFVEEQKPGVFRKTLRNMWLGVSIFNPLMALVALNTLSLATIEKASDFMLADVAMVLGSSLGSATYGTIVQYVVAIDALLVLAGAVLTSYVGVGGLIQRMALDGCLPNILTKQNKKGSFPLTVISFFLLCSSILVITAGDLLSLAGVYTIAFLGVMSLFAIGNLILKREREELKRTYWSPVRYVVIAAISTFAGLIGNILINTKNLEYFLIYFIPTALVVMLMIYQDYVLDFAYKFASSAGILKGFVGKMFNSVIRLKIVVFIHDISKLHDILRYIAKNEVGRNITLISCAHNKQEIEFAREISEALPILKKAGVYDFLQITHETVDTEFGPDAIFEASKRHHVPVNRILIGTVRDEHGFSYDELGGVRIVI